MANKKTKRQSKATAAKSGWAAYAQAKPKIAVFSDSAIPKDNPGADDFGLSQRVGPVYDIIRHEHTETPLTIGIYGGWGTGKSSAMRWLNGLLKHWNTDGPSGRIKVYPIWFEPWKYQEKEDVWRGLIAEVILECIDVKNLTWDNAPARITQAAKQFGGFLGRSFLHALSSVKLKAPGAEVDLGLISDIHGEYQKAAHPEAGYLNAFETTLKNWVGDALDDDERIVIFIDDLDRCLPSVTLQVLEAIKLYLGIENLIFVIGVDRDVVNCVVQNEYAKHGVTEDKAKEYLDKMFQVDIEIAPNQTQVEGFIEQLFDRVGELAGECWKQLDEDQQHLFRNSMLGLARRNPRELKRLVNSALIAGAGAEQDPPEGGEAMNFAQGVQVFLVRRVLSRVAPSQVDMLGTTIGVEFFTAWSRAVCEDKAPVTEPNIRFWINPKQESKTVTGTIKTTIGVVTAERSITEQPVPEDQASIHAGYKAIADDPRFRRYLELLDQDQLGELMRVPFSTAALRLAPGSTLPINGGAEGGQVILDAVAHQWNIHVDELETHHFTHLEELSLYGARDVDNGLKAIAQAGMTKLRILYLEDSGVTDEGVKAIAQAGMTRMKILDLENTCTTDKGLNAIAQAGMTELQRLFINKTGVTDEGLKAIAQAGMTQLTYLWLSHTAISDEGLKTIAQAGMTKMERLFLENTGINDEGVKAIAQAGMTRMEYLNLGKTGTTDEGIKAIARAGMTRMESLNLSSTKITDEGLKAIARAGMTNLKHLYLFDTGVTDEGFNAIAQAGFSNLRTLDLRNTRITEAAHKDLKSIFPKYGRSDVRLGPL